jgi:flavin-binding protein dodecin
MGKPVQAGEGTIYFGKSDGASGDSATLDEALASAAAKVVGDRLVTPDQTVWFDIVSMQVEIANQHVRTYRVGITPQGGGSGDTG